MADKRRSEFVTDEEQRLLEIEDMRLVVKFGDKKRYSDREYEAIYQELAEAGLVGDAWHDLDAIEAVFKKRRGDCSKARSRRVRLNDPLILPMLCRALRNRPAIRPQRGNPRQPPGVKQPRDPGG
jgi:hypothetical protein